MINALQNNTNDVPPPAPEPQRNSEPPANPPVALPRQDVVSIQPLAVQMEKARQAAEESQRETMPATGSSDGSARREPLEAEVERHVRLARTAPVAVTRYLMTMQDNQGNPWADHTGGVNVRA
ncbi:MAG: hypothetical protein HQM03_02115 [Magnetococcales bacterium]|nr:hypothetical protein [Magnetococcales bacterium]